MRSGRRTAWVAFSLYAAFVIYGTTIPWEFDLDPVALSMRWREIQWEVLRIDNGRVRGRTDLVANVLFFMPLGISWTLAWRPRTLVGAATGATLIGVGLSCLVEGIQLLAPDRVTSMSDVLLNATGCGVAAGTTWSIHLRYGRLIAKRIDGWLRGNPEGGLAAMGIGLLLLEATSPFDLTVDLGDVKMAIRALMDDPVGVANLAEALERFLLYGLAGFLVTRQLKESELAQRLGTATSVVAAVAMGTEVLQLFVRSRVPGIGDTVLGVGGGLVGSIACAAIERRLARDRPVLAPMEIVLPGDCVRVTGRLAMACFLIYVGAGALQPYELAEPSEIAAKIGGQVFVPFWSYYVSLGTSVVGDFFGATVTFGVFGYVYVAQRLAQGELPARSHVRSAAALGSAVAAGFEGAQLFLAGRTVDLTDLWLAAIGTWAGIRFYAWLVNLSLDPYVSPWRDG